MAADKALDCISCAALATFTDGPRIPVGVESFERTRIDRIDERAADFAVVECLEHEIFAAARPQGERLHLERGIDAFARLAPRGVTREKDRLVSRDVAGGQAGLERSGRGGHPHVEGEHKDDDETEDGESFAPSANGTRANDDRDGILDEDDGQAYLAPDS